METAAVVVIYNIRDRNEARHEAAWRNHGATITVDSEVDAFTEFVVTLPRQIFANSGSRA